MSISRLICLVVVLLIPPSNFRVAANADDVLSRRLSVDAQEARPLDYIVLLLRQSGIWGGIEAYDSGCSKEPDLLIPALDGTLGDGLVLINKLVTSIKWQVFEEGLLIVKGTPKSSILDTKIYQFTYNSNDPANKVTNAIFADPAVAKNIIQQGFTVGSPELGFAQPRNDSEKDVILNNVTVREALNSVAHSSRPRIWLFQQRTCDGHKNLSVNWVGK